MIDMSKIYIEVLAAGHSKGVLPEACATTRRPGMSRCRLLGGLVRI